MDDGLSPYGGLPTRDPYGALSTRDYEALRAYAQGLRPRMPGQDDATLDARTWMTPPQLFQPGAPLPMGAAQIPQAQGLQALAQQPSLVGMSPDQFAGSPAPAPIYPGAANAAYRLPNQPWTQVPLDQSGQPMGTPGNRPPMSEAYRPQAGPTAPGPTPAPGAIAGTSQQQFGPTPQVPSAQQAMTYLHQLGFDTSNPATARLVPKAQQALYEQNMSRYKDQLGVADLQSKIAARAAPKAPLVTIDQKGQGAEEAEAGKKAADRLDAMVKSSTAAPDRLARVEFLHQVLASVPTGPMAEAIGSGIAWARSAGIPDTVIKNLGLNPKQAAAKEVANKMQSEMVLESIGASAGGGGMPANNFSDADREFLQKKFPNITNQSEANEIVYETLKAVEERKLLLANEWDAYANAQADAGKTPRYSDFERLWRQTRGKENIFDEAQRKYAIFSGGGTAGGAGTAPSAAIDYLRANPGLKAQFDEKYGAGAADRALGGAR